MHVEMDQALPERNILQLYKSLTSDKAAILIQAKTGHRRLNQYLSRVRVVDEVKYRC
jgi:hypothetical protein